MAQEVKKLKELGYEFNSIDAPKTVKLLPVLRYGQFDTVGQSGYRNLMKS